MYPRLISFVVVSICAPAFKPCAPPSQPILSGMRRRAELCVGGAQRGVFVLEALDGVEQPCRRQLQEVESEGRILEIKLHDVIVGDRQGLARLDALDRRGAALARLEQAEF